MSGAERRMRNAEAMGHHNGGALPTPYSGRFALAAAAGLYPRAEPSSADRWPDTPHAKGFTLIEIAVVIVILGVMITLVAPRLGELGDANLKRSARHLTGMIRFLRDEAQAKKAVYRLRFDIQDGHYWVEGLTATPEQTLEFTPVQSVIAGEGRLSGETTFRDVVAGSHRDDPYMLFMPDGWVERALIHLRDGNDRDFTLLVQPLTGRTELREGYVEEER